jgi:hypothetical protein
VAASQLIRIVCVAAMVSTLACGDKGEPAAPPAKVDPEPTSTPANPPPATAGLETIDADQYWLLRALGMVRAEREAGEGLVVTLEDLGGEERTVAVSRQALQDTTARDEAYPRAVHLLGRELGAQNEERRVAAEKRLEQLTKTTRADSMGPTSPWLAWYREFGDFIRYNPDLERVEVDEALAESGRAASVDGLGLKVVGDADRFKRGEPIKITVVLTRDPSTSPRWVNQRLRIPDDVSLELELEEDDRTTAVALLEPAALGEPVREDFALLAPGEGVRTTIELTKLVEGPLAPGTYAVSATYRNGQAGSELGLDEAGGEAWTGEVSSARHRFRIVPW